MSIVRSVRALLAVSAVSAVTLVPSFASAQPAADGEAEAARISSAGRTLKWNWQPPGKSDRFGHGEAIVHASADKVRAAVTNYASYKSFNPRFVASNVIGHPEGGIDVYMKFSAVHGMVTLWDVMRFSFPRAIAPGTEVVEGRYLRGNVKDANVVWTVKEVDENFTVLKCDLLLKPDLPAPQSALDEELRDAAQQAVDGVRERAQGDNAWVRWTKS